MVDFEDAGYVLLRGLVGEAERLTLCAHAIEVGQRSTTFRADPQVPNTPVAYADPVMEALMEALRPQIEAHTGRALFPTYSYYRVYKRGDALPKHTDRESCELSLSLCVGYEGAAPWPLYLESRGEPKAVLLSPGDALLYKGMLLPHWRLPFEGERAVQVFLHYVDQNGPYAAWKFDERPGLNL